MSSPIPGPGGRRPRPRRQAVRRFSATRRGAVLVLLAGTHVAMADDTEVFFASDAAAVDAPNVLFIVPASRAMGCPVGSTDRCAIATDDGSSRMDAVRTALDRVIASLAESGVSVGLMRPGKGGDSAATSRGGFVVQEVAPLDPERATQFRRWICPPGLDPTACNLVRPITGDGPGLPVLAPANHSAFCAVDATGKPVCDGRPDAGRQRLTELLFEANRYFAGRRPVWGRDSRVGPGYRFPGDGYDPPSIWGPATVDAAACAADTGACRYLSPTGECRRNLIVVISDGLLAPDDGNDTGSDSIANSAGDAAPYDRWFRPYRDPGGLTSGPAGDGCSANTGIVHSPVDPGPGDETPGTYSDCPDDLAYSMRNGGFVASLPSAQVFTHTVAFDLGTATRAEAVAEESPRRLLQLLARAGGGRFHAVECDGCTPAQAADELTRILEGIVGEAVVAQATFTAPTVPVNAFNRTETLDELYLSVFRPVATQRWRGNVRKYRVAANGDFLGRDDALAVDPQTGALLPDVASLWPADSVDADGDDVLAGGAAHGLPEPAGRRIYTNENGANASALASYGIDQVARRDDAAALLGYLAAGLEPPECPGAPGDRPADPDNPAICQLIEWVLGTDVADRAPEPSGNGDYTDPRYDLGDPLHSRPAVVTYGLAGPKPRSIVYAMTNDGLLHAFDADSGRERWAFLPWSQLGRLLSLYRDAAALPRRSLGLDGSLRVLELDRNGNGVIEPAADGRGDRVILYFGMRRGGRSYHALDVTEVDFDDPAGDRPKLLWIAGPDDDPLIPASLRLPLVGQTWSRPVATRLKVPGHPSDDDRVVLFGGGYDPDTQDPVDDRPQPYVAATRGTGLYVLDAFTGQLLWRAGPDPGADLQLPALTAAIPADVTALDLNGDEYLDVAYVGDLGGRIWRIDFDAAAASLERLASGGVLADLGGAGVAGARRFFASPDVSAVVRAGRRWLNVAIGSGHRELPVSDRETDDRFYSIRDFSGLDRRDWSRFVALTEAELTDVTPEAGPSTVQAPVPADSAGWMLRLQNHAGEKAVSSSRTLDHTIFFPTFVPQARRDVAEGDACGGGIGYNHLYQVSVIDGRPARRLSETALPTTARGLAIRLDQPGIAPEPMFLFPAPEPGPAEDGPAVRPPPVCLVGAETCGNLAVLAPRRTYWRQHGAE